MTPKEKAEELVDKMLFCFQGHIDEYTAKQCALIAIDELIIQEQQYNNGSFYPSNYWKEVKQKIEKL